jgi:hypothetical protein
MKPLITFSCFSVALLGATASSIAAAFTPGDLIVYRVGDGSTPLTNAATAVFLDEFTIGGSLVQSIPVPTELNGSNFRLTDTGTGTSDGQLNLSPDGTKLSFAGYDAALGTASVASSNTTTVARTIGYTGSTAVIDTTTTTTAFSGNNIRAAVINGTDIYAVGGNSGVVSMSIGGSGAGTTISSTQTNLRDVAIYGGQLYVSSGSGTDTTKGVNAVGSGVPTTTGQTTVRIPGLSDTTNPSTYAFAFADLSLEVAGVDTLYFADDGAGALSKFSLVEGNWISNGTVGTTADDYRGLTLSVAGSSVNLFATRKGGSGAPGGGELVGLLDASGYNGAFTGTPTVLATAGNQTAFRGVAFAPVAVPEPSTLLSVIGGAGMLAMSRRRRNCR